MLDIWQGSEYGSYYSGNLSAGTWVLPSKFSTWYQMVSTVNLQHGINN